ncbi:hypothetical protein F5X99DRAFT_363888 [Biscogniauxia marginata]|nr:hypothetical protein F5X99DRAFT_363888 [Biscogniauxia marginata]
MDNAPDRGDEAADRLQAELDLLTAMYPDAISYTPNARELRYSHFTTPLGTKHPASSTLVLRLPDAYPVEGFPDIISATGPRKEDLRSAARAAFRKLDVSAGEELLDALLLAFQDLVSSQQESDHLPDAENGEDGNSNDNGSGDVSPRYKTVIIWLHHLLNMNKRKLALSPTSAAGPGSGEAIAGLTKPGYPGVLIFSGPRTAVDAHVAELRNQRWQAFQVRFDSDDAPGTGPASRRWLFGHGSGIREVGSMSDVAQGISDPEQREVFLGAIGVK